MAYYAIITDAGQALLAEAIASSVPVTLTQFAVGDGGGQPVVPDPTMTALVHETYRNSISGLTISPEQPDALVAQLVVPAESGGYTVREVGLFTDDGTLFSIANYPDQPKPIDDGSGYAIKLDLRYVLAVSDTSAITIVIQPGDYLTKEAADALYLDTVLNLAEIAAAGEEAQQEARYHLALGSAATHDDMEYVNTVNNHGPDANGALYVTSPDIFEQQAIGIPDAQDLNNYQTPGVYFQPSIAQAQTGANYPEATAGSLMVYKAAGVIQVYRVYVGTALYARTFYADAWSPWARVYDNNYKPTSVDVGAYPITGGTLNGGLWANGAVVSNSGDVIAAAGVYESAGQVRVYSTNNPPPASAGDSYSDTMMGAQAQLETDGPAAEAPVGCVITGGNGNEGDDWGFMFYRPMQKNVWGAWYTITWL